MSQKETQKENSQKAVTLSQNPRSSQVEIALTQASQYEVSVSAASGQVTVSSSGPANVAVHGQVIVSQGQFQNQIAPQENVSSQASVSTQDTSPRARGLTQSQMLDACNSLLNRIPDRPKYSRIKNIDDLMSDRKIGMKRLLDRWMAKNEQSDSQDGETLTKTRKLLDDKNSSQPKSQ